MTEAELTYMEETLPKGVFNRHKEIWLKAFRVYNEAHEKKEHKGMNCSPCYKIVFDYHKKNLKK